MSNFLIEIHVTAHKNATHVPCAMYHLTCHYITCGTCGIYATLYVKNIKKLPKWNLKQKQKRKVKPFIHYPPNICHPLGLEIPLRVRLLVSQKKFLVDYARILHKDSDYWPILVVCTWNQVLLQSSKSFLTVVVVSVPGSSSHVSTWSLELKDNYSISRSLMTSILLHSCLKWLDPYFWKHYLRIFLVLVLILGCPALFVYFLFCCNLS